MSTDLVPYDRAVISDGEAEVYALRILARSFCEAFQAIIQAAESIGTVVANIAKAFNVWAERYYPYLQIMTLADPSQFPSGHVERHPVTGVKWRVAGRKGNRHWIPSGPRRARWWK